MTQITSAKTPLRRSLTSSLALVGGLLVISPSLRAQATPPPIDGVTGTVAPGASVQADQAIHVVIAKTADGVEHLFHYAKALFVHHKKGGGEDTKQ